MRRVLLLLLLFVAVNLLLGYLHIKLFQSAWPFSAWGSMLLHGIALLLFPYAVFLPKQPR